LAKGTTRAPVEGTQELRPKLHCSIAVEADRKFWNSRLGAKAGLFPLETMERDFLPWVGQMTWSKLQAAHAKLSL